MSLRLGIDLGVASEVPAAAPLAAALGARLGRFACPLAVERPFPDEIYLTAIQGAARCLRRQGIEPLIVVDGRLTVAPEGPTAFGQRTTPTLAAAWHEELLGNLDRLVATVGDAVALWEILPTPNARQRTTIEPAMWGELLGETAALIRQRAPQAAIIAGGLLSNEEDDGVDYLRAAYSAIAASAAPPGAKPAFDYLGVHMRILPMGAPSEEILRAALAERVSRLWRALEQLSVGRLAPRGIMVTSLAWDAGHCGELAQAKNLATAVEALAADPVVQGVVWASLVDRDGSQSGLFRGEQMAADARRPAWQAFSEQADRLGQPLSPAPSRPSGAATPVLRLRIPDARQVLESMGLEGAALESALTALRARYGEPALLGPGDYEIPVPPPTAE